MGFDEEERDGTPKNPKSLKFRSQRERDLTRKKETGRLRIRKAVNLGVSVSGI